MRPRRYIFFGHIFSKISLFFLSLPPIMTKQKILAVKTNRHVMDLSTEVLATFPNNGSVTVYNVIDRTTADYGRILNCALFFARQGKNVIITPKVDVPYKNSAYNKIYSTLKGTAYFGKCPDLHINTDWYEHEGFSGNNPKRSFRNMCNHGFKQSDKIIIEDCGLSDGYMLRSLEGQIKAGTKVSELWVHSNNEYRQVFKTES